MNRSLGTLIGGCMTFLIIGAIGLLLLVSLLPPLLSSLVIGGAGIGTSLGADMGTGGSPCTPSTPLSGSGTATATASPPATRGTGSACLPATGVEAAVVQLALQMAAHLSVNPACQGTISFPNCYYTWYESGFPPAVIAYGEQVCPGCAAWANGTYQCVSFVRGAYSQAYPMQQTANAFDLWAVYQGKPGWMEIPSAAAPPGQRGLPLPGDVIVWQDASVGHVAIATSVLPPRNGQDGEITFANANSSSPLDQMVLHPDLSVSTWPGYTVWGYIRPAVTAFTTGGATFKNAV